MALHGLYLCGTSTFQTTPRNAEVQLYEIDILCMTWPYLQCLYPPWPQQVAPRHIFHLAIPGWAVRRSSKSFFWARTGITTRFPQEIQPLCVLNSFLLSYKGSRLLSGHLSPHPCWTLLTTWCRTGSEAVQAAMWSAFTGMNSRRSIRSMVSSGTGAVTTVSGKGNRLRTSALPCLHPSRYTSS